MIARQKSAKRVENGRKEPLKLGISHSCPAQAADGSDNPNKGLGILAGCAADKLFTAGEWGAEFHASMAPAAAIWSSRARRASTPSGHEPRAARRQQDRVRRALRLPHELRTAYEKGFNTITLTDLCATTSPEGQTGATEGTFGMFSAPMTGEEFLGKL
ncbi:isochorismatase-like protein [Aureococcus anophagefferens]|nr:isochorismatase-like protein [Aureococcus anophagefferens]